MSEDHLEHHGVKGQKWGVRHLRDNGSGPVPVETRIRPGKMVKTSGGKHHSAHEDAVKAATARQKAKKSTLDSLSNRELQDLVNRMNLEQQYSRLITTIPSAQSDVLKIVKRVNTTASTINKVHAFINSPGGKALKLALKTQLKR
jgi:hypothetical protein